jgi:spore coat-associated protein N
MTENNSPAVAKKRLSKGQRTVLAVGSVGAAALIGLGGVFAAFTGTVTSAAQPISTGQLSVALDGAAGSSVAAFTASITEMAPGDVNNRFITLRNSSSEVTASSGTFQVTDTPATTKLATDVTNGLQIRVDRCSVAWTLPAGTCSGTTTTVVTQQSLNALGTARTITGLNLAPGASWFLRVTNTLPTAADNTFSSLTENLTYRFNVNQ